MSSPEPTHADAAQLDDEPTDSDDASVDESIDVCPVIDSLEQIGSKWRLVVIHDLEGEEKRFNELKRSTDANSRTLSRVLDDLQELDFVDRRVEAESPVATYYTLTEKGESLCPVFDEIETWAGQWLDACDEGSDVDVE